MVFSWDTQNIKIAAFFTPSVVSVQCIGIMWILEVNVDAVSVNAKLSLSAPIKFLLIYFKQYVFAVKSNYNINRASEIRIHTIQEVAVENYSQTLNHF